MKVKGLKRIDKVVNNFTAKFGVSAFLDTKNGFQAYPNEKVISYNIFADDNWIKCFAEEANNRYNGIEADPFLWGLMHEIGHCMTDIWDEEDEAFFSRAKENLETFFDTIEEMNTWYHVIPDEYFATKWAADFMRKHPKMMEKFNKKMNEAMNNFCEKNGITLDKRSDT